MYGMTGYSCKEQYFGKVYVFTEIKSVNSRFLDINVYLPSYLNFMDIKIREMIKKKLIRGKIDISVSIKFNEDAYEVKADLKLAKKYIENLKQIIDHFNLKDDIRLFHLTKYDDVINIERKKDYDKYWDIISKSLLENLKEVTKMKKKEGEAIKKDLLSIIKNINNNVNNIAKNVPKMEKDIFDTIKNKIKEFLDNDIIDENKLLNEVVLSVNRSCINEEIKRLLSHIDYFKSIINEESSVGKRLDFLCQEMHREINTIGSKATLVKLTGNVISIKNDIEKMREQIRNSE